MFTIRSLGVETKQKIKAIRPDSDPEWGSAPPIKRGVFPPGSDLMAFFMCCPHLDSLAVYRVMDWHGVAGGGSIGIVQSAPVLRRSYASVKWRKEDASASGDTPLLSVGSSPTGGGKGCRGHAIPHTSGKALQGHQRWC